MCKMLHCTWCMYHNMCTRGLMPLGHTDGITPKMLAWPKIVFDMRLVRGSHADFAGSPFLPSSERP